MKNLLLALLFSLFTIAIAAEQDNQVSMPTTTEDSVTKKMDKLQQEMQQLQESVDQKQKELSELKKQMQTLPTEKAADDIKLPPEYVTPEKATLPPANNTIANETNSAPINEPLFTVEKPPLIAAPTDDKKAIPAAMVTNSKDQRTMYDSAFALVKARRYTEAIASMRAYLQKYSTGQYAANAHYWLGQLFMVSGENDNAIIEFSEVVKSFSTSAKAPDSMLTLGSLAYTQSQWKEAREWWEDVIKKYPTSAAAEIAKNYLLQLDKEGN